MAELFADIMISVLFAKFKLPLGSSLIVPWAISVKVSVALRDDFYLLNFAWEDVDYYRDGTNNYWPGAQPNTINAIVIDEAEKWLAEYGPGLIEST